MKVDIKIPQMGESVTEAIVSNIMKPSGSFVARDEEILELETDKVNQPLYAAESGRLDLMVQVGDKVVIGQTIGSIDTEKKGAVQEEKPVVQAPVEVAPSSFSARKMPEERFTKAPEQKPATIPNVPQTPVNTNRRKMSNLRKVIAERLVEAKNTTAMLTSFNEVDLSSVIAIRAREKDAFFAKYGVKLGFMSFFIKAAVAALQEFPDVNSQIEGDEIVTPKSQDIAVAVSTERGLMVPVIRNCADLSFGLIEKSLETLAKQAREGRISVDALRGGSFTITNGGVFGSLLSTPILNLPQSAILGMHSIVKRPVVVDDQIVIRPMMYLALSYDHRIIDGKEAVLFLVHIKKSLEDPTRLLLDL